MDRLNGASATLVLTLTLGCAASPPSTGAPAEGAEPVASARSTASGRPAKRNDPLAGWMRFTDGTGTYELTMPIPPNELDTSAPSDAGTLTLHMATASATDGGVYLSQFMEVRGVIMDLDTAVKRMDLATSSVKTVKFQGQYEGREVEGAKKDGTKMFALLFIADQRYFCLLSAGDIDPLTVRAFWDSFKLLK